MIKRGISEAIYVILALMIAILPAAARAQGGGTYLNAPSPEKIAVTSGGVDIRTGRYAYDRKDISVGEGSGGGSLALKRTMPTSIVGHVSPFGNFSHNWDILLTIKIDVGGQDALANVHFGGRSQTYEWTSTNPSWTQKSKNDITMLTSGSSSLQPGLTYTYTDDDGTVAVFRPMAYGECSYAAINIQCAFISHLIEPDGTRYDFEYETTTAAQPNKARLRSVVSSRGYALALEYGAGGGNWNTISKACAVNLASVAKPSTNICPAAAHATANYSYSTVGGKPVLTAASDASTATDSFSYTDDGTYVTSVAFKNPGKSTPWLTNSVQYSPTNDGGADEAVVAQNFADGSSYTYSYDYTPDTSSGDGMQSNFPSIAGGSYTNALGHETQIRYDFPAMPNSLNPPQVYSGGTGFHVYVNVGDIVFQVTPGPATIIDPLGRTTTNNYCYRGANGTRPLCDVSRLQFSIDPEGGMVKIKYGGMLKPIEIRTIAKPGSGLTDTVETAAYPLNCALSAWKMCAKPITVTDAKGITTDYSWSADHGGVLSETKAAPAAGAARPQKRFTYGQFFARYLNSAGVLTQSTTPVWLVTQISECRIGIAPACVGTADETRTSFVYGSPTTANNLLATSKTVASGDGALSATTSWTYDAAGNKASEDGPLPGPDDTTYWFYDAMWRVRGEIGPDPDGTGPLLRRATRNTYDLDGLLIKVERGTVTGTTAAAFAAFTPLQIAETDYDLLNRKIAERSREANGTIKSLTQFSYDLAGRLECTAVRMNPVLFATPPASACTLGTAGSDGPDRITKLTHDAAGQLIKTTVAFGTPQQADDETNAYTLNGKLASVTDGENNKTTFEYDGHDRLSKTRYPVAALGALASSTTDFEQLTYDGNDNITQRRLRDGNLINYSYDTLNRVSLKDIVTPQGYLDWDVTYTYDNMDRQKTATGDGWAVNAFTYDALGRLTIEQNYNETKTYQYDIAGRRTKLIWADGLNISYDYNVAGQMTAVRENGATTGPGLLATYSYDNLGRRTGITRGNGTTSSYSYDGVSRLSSLAHNLSGTASDYTASFTYTPSSQIASVSRSNDAYVWQGHYNVARPYGTNGLNQLTSAGATPQGYDGRGNLTQSGSSSFTYTSENRMATSGAGAFMVHNPGSAQRLLLVYQNGVDTRFDWSGDDLTTEINGTTWQTMRRYAHGPESDDPLVWYEGPSTSDRRWLHADERGSIIAVSNSAGAALAINRYDEYGIPASTNIGRFQYTGQAWLPEVGLYYYKARMYSPTLGRFMQTDPIGYGDGINWYDYVDGDPVNLGDSNGQSKGRRVGPTGAVAGLPKSSAPGFPLMPRFQPPMVRAIGGSSVREQHIQNSVYRQHFSILGESNLGGVCPPTVGKFNATSSAIQSALGGARFDTQLAGGARFHLSASGGGLSAARNFAQSIPNSGFVNRGGNNVAEITGLPSGVSGTVSYRSKGTESPYDRAEIHLTGSSMQTGSRIPTKIQTVVKVAFPK